MTALRPSLTISSALLILTTASGALAQNREPEAVFERAERREESGVDVHFPRNVVDPLFDPIDRARTCSEGSGGPTFLGLYAPIWQTGSHGRDDHTLSQSFNLYGEWTLLENPENEGTLYLFYLHESESLGTTAGQFADGIGTTILPNDDVGNTVNALGHIGWTQKLFDGALELAVGQLALKLMLDQNDYAGWDRTSFMAQPLAGNSVRNFPIAALGFDTTVHVTDELQVSFLVADADGSPFYPDFESFGRQFVYVPGLVYTPTIPGLGKGRYEVNFSHTERTERFAPGPSSSVLLLSLQQEVSRDLAAFFRFGTGDGRRTTVQRSIATGVVFTQAFGMNQDWIGVGFIWTDPSDNNRSDDFGVETFWRLQLTEKIQVTPDVQLFFDPSGRPGSDVEAAFGLRVGVFF